MPLERIFALLFFLSSCLTFLLVVYMFANFNARLWKRYLLTLTSPSIITTIAASIAEVQHIKRPWVDKTMGISDLVITALLALFIIFFVNADRNIFIRKKYFTFHELDRPP